MFTFSEKAKTVFIFNIKMCDNDGVCRRCSIDSKENKHRLDPLLFPITYASQEVMETFSLPRKYTSTHDDEKKEIYLSIGSDYNERMLQTEEVILVESQVIGKWVKRGKKYEIHLRVLVTTEKNPQAFIRNKIFCEELGVVLEGIALAETCVLLRNPSLTKSKIYIHFESVDPEYKRVEYWGKLGYWRAN